MHIFELSIQLGTFVIGIGLKKKGPRMKNIIIDIYWHIKIFVLQI